MSVARRARGRRLRHRGFAATVAPARSSRGTHQEPPVSAIPFETVASTQVPGTTRRFYVAMAALFVVIAFTAFIASYWAKVSR